MNQMAASNEAAARNMHKQSSLMDKHSRSGNESTNAPEKIWKEYSASLRAFIQSKVSDTFAVDDILQDVFLKMYSALPSLKDHTRIQSWLYQITRNTIIDYYRTLKSAGDLPDEIPEPDTDPGEDALRRLASSIVPMMLLLPPAYRDAVYLSEIEGLAQREVAERQGISLSGAKSRIQRGRKELKQLLELCCEYEFDQAGRLSDYKSRLWNCEKDCR